MDNIIRLVQTDWHAHATGQQHETGALKLSTQSLIPSRSTALQQLHPYRRQFTALRRSQKVSRQNVKKKQPKPYIRSQLGQLHCHMHACETACQELQLMLQRQRCQEVQENKGQPGQCASKTKFDCGESQQLCTACLHAEQKSRYRGERNCASLFILEDLALSTCRNIVSHLQDVLQESGDWSHSTHAHNLSR